MRKIKINLSKDTVNNLIKSIDRGSAQSMSEAEEMDRLSDELFTADKTRDENGRIEVKRETLDWIIAELDWFYSAYCEEVKSRC